MSRIERVSRVAVGGFLALALVAALAPTCHGLEPASGKHWVFFTDKGIVRGEEQRAIDQFAAKLTPRALWRRGKVGKSVDLNDVPVSSAYVWAVEGAGAEVVARSRWLNAVSVRADDEVLGAIAELPFVRDVRPVARATERRLELIPAPGGGVRRGGRALDYGESEGQLAQVQIPDLHEAGFDGLGVIIAMLDTGFDTDHQAYRHLDVVAERDFINWDSETANQPGDPSGQDSHGTATLSCVGAAYPGEIYGGSYSASFILCKTEIVDEEIEIEEDYWAEAIEFADSLGADLVSSSLGYFDWYTYEDMDGNTAVTSIAADMAAARGIVVVNSMGNEGGSDWMYMIAPADGDSVISVGAVELDGDRVWFSSVGPTYDGRIKPDVMALGSNAYVATTADTDSYAHSSGTSFSCPITAGAVGLLLEGHPDWTPEDVIDALHSTGTRSTTPDTLMGWGIVQAYDAMYWEPLAVESEGVLTSPRLVWSAPNPFAGATEISFVVRERSPVSVEIYDVAGRLVRVLSRGERPPGSYGVRWDGRDASGREAASGVYLCRVTGVGLGGTAKVVLLR